jgi:hypothetical protein
MIDRIRLSLLLEAGISTHRAVRAAKQVSARKINSQSRKTDAEPRGRGWRAIVIAQPPPRAGENR